MKKSRIGLIHTQALCALCDEELANFTREVLDKGATIYAKDFELLFFKSGSGKLSFFEGGEEFILYYLYANNMTLLDETCAVEVLESSEIYSIKAENIDALFKNFAFNEACSQALFDLIALQRQIIKSILFESAKERVANFLIELALEQDLKQNGYRYVFLPFSITVLSSFVGLKRQSTSTVFNELLKDDVIRKLSPHEFLIVDFERLKSYTN